MRNAILVICSVIAASLSMPQSVFAAESISTFESDVIIQKSGVVSVRETIVYDFGKEDRHGIFRYIPYRYANFENKNFDADITINSVVDESAAAYPYTLSRSGGTIEVKIGDPDKTISGTHTYIINYDIAGVIQEYSDHQELYWNITGNGWPVPIRSTYSQIVFEDTVQIEPDQLAAVCYTGFAGSSLQDCTITPRVNGYEITTGGLGAGEGLTVAVSFPLNTVTYIPLAPAKDYSPFWIALILFWLFIMNVIVPGIFLWMWWRGGRDPSHHISVVRGFEPPKDASGRLLTPMEAGTVVDEVINPRDISAELIHLAVNKYIIIHEHAKKFLGLVPGDITIERGPAYEVDPDLSELQPHQKTLFEAFKLHTKASSSLKDIKKSLHTKLTSLKDDMYQELVDDGFFPENPEKRRNMYTGFGVASLVLGGFLTGALLIILARSMGRRTFAGVQAKQTALGLKEFLVSQERQYKFQEKNALLFEKLLPYAIMFGVTKIWAKKFEQFTEYSPDWYQNDSNKLFNALVFTDHLEKNISSIENSYTPTSTSSSSGFSSGFSGGSSGGGFGGGGGGSW